MDFEVRRDDLHDTRIVERPPAALAEGEARLAVKRFGFSANNITYAVFGDMMRYWTFFPTDDGWGRIPVWGFAEVVESAGATGLDEGELVYGYLPMGSELVVRPTRVNEHGFTDASAHRSELPSAYNGYTRCSTDPVYAPDTEALQMLLRPLFMTDFVLDDWLADSGFFGARHDVNGMVVLSSASSKTSFGLAHLLAQRDERPEIVGLTSAGNIDFVTGLGVYDTVLAYDRVGELDPGQPSVYVDMAGDSLVRHDVHSHLKGLNASVSVGGTHWDRVGGAGDLPGPAPALFFAPDQIVKRRNDWGPGGVETRFAVAWEQFLPVVDHWITVVERAGAGEMARTYLEVLAGANDPSEAFVITPDA